jgi:threonylcarbamoyladenosine tRNA methylthiotransferase MtaB
MRTFHITNFGCRATQADAAAIKREFLARGFTPDGAGAEILVFNTCTVTASADAQARQAIREARRANPSARIVVTGCYAQRAPEELAQIEGVSLVVGNAHQTEIPWLLESPGNFVPLLSLTAARSSPAKGGARIYTGDIAAARKLAAAPLLEDFAGEAIERTRPVLKIQDGCDHRCSYCIIPAVRGASRSLPPRVVIQQLGELAAAGYQEVVLSGIDLGSYGRDLVPRETLVALLPRILRETAIPRLRLSSIEPRDITEELLSCVASSDRIAPHFHVPLQSGSDRILRAMHRWYRAAHYARRIELARARLPGAAIGADVIAGFPGETEADHAATVRLIEALPFTYLHVFSYSPRPGTRAAELPDEISPAVIRRRSRELRELGEAKAAAFRAHHVGRTLRVVTLRRTGGQNGDAWTEALSGNYLKIRLRGLHAPNRLLDAHVVAVSGRHLVANPALPQSSRVKAVAQESRISSRESPEQARCDSCG